jgi:hypothetical protein
VKASSPSTHEVRAIRADLARLGAPRQQVDPTAVEIMKPGTRERPFSRGGSSYDPLLPVLDLRPDLERSLELLGERLS